MPSVTPKTRQCGGIPDPRLNVFLIESDVWTNHCTRARVQGIADLSIRWPNWANLDPYGYPTRIQAYLRVCIHVIRICTPYGHIGIHYTCGTYANPTRFASSRDPTDPWSSISSSSEPSTFRPLMTYFGPITTPNWPK